MYFNILDKTYDNEQYGGTKYTIQITNELESDITSTKGNISKKKKYSDNFTNFELSESENNNIFSILNTIFPNTTLPDCLFEITDDKNNFLLTFKSSNIKESYHHLILNKNLKIYIKKLDDNKHKNEITLISNDNKIYKRINLNLFKKISYLSIYTKDNNIITDSISITENDLIYSTNTIKDFKQITITNQLNSDLTINEKIINTKKNTIIYYDTTNNIIDILKDIFKTYISAKSTTPTTPITITTLIEIQNEYGITFLFNDLKNNNNIYYNENLKIWIKERQKTDKKINLIYINKDNKMTFNKISKTDFSDKLLKTNFYYYIDTTKKTVTDITDITDYMMLYTDNVDNLYTKNSKMCKVILNISNTSSIIENEIDNPETVNIINYLLNNDEIKTLDKELYKEFYFKITIEGAVLIDNPIFYIPFIDLNTNNKFFLKKHSLHGTDITYSKIRIDLLKDIDETIDNPIIDDKLYLWIFNKQNFDLKTLNKNDINTTEYYFYNDENNKVLLTYCNYIPYRLVYNKELSDNVIKIKDVNNLIKLYNKKLASENNDIIKYLYQNMIGILQDPYKSSTVSKTNSDNQIIDLNSDDNNNNNNIILLGGSSSSINYLDNYIDLFNYIDLIVNLFNINLILTINTSEISTSNDNIKFMELITG